MTTAIISHPDCALHEMGPDHPECPARLAAIQDQLIASGLDSVLRHIEAPLASRAQLERAHAPDYVERVFQASPPPGQMTWLDPDTAMNEHSLQAALRAAGAQIRAVDLVMQGKINNAFCNVRPPGHHAGRSRAMGFCLFNNVAVGVTHLLQEYKLERVAIVDFDVHHGNGTEDIFQGEPRVLLCSTFQHPYYPYCGADTRSEHIVNVPLPAGAGGTVFRQAVTTHWLPKLEHFQPEFVYVSAGFDAHVEDYLADLALTEADYTWVTQQIKAVADTHCRGRIVSTLEGGYALGALGRSVVAHLNALIGYQADSVGA